MIDEISQNIGDGLRQDALPRFSRFDGSQEPEPIIKTIQDEVSYFGL